jgi:hypothetical protein
MSLYSKSNTARHSRLTPVILATQEAEIRRIKVPSQQIVPETVSQKKPITKESLWSGSRCRP